ncbi:MAG: DUF305 domain-containing protein [Actinocatenispora sp.]
MTRPYPRRALLAAAVGLTALTVTTGCDALTGDDDNAGGGGSSGGDHNSSDVMFAQMMIPHHRQAVEMSELVPLRAADPGIKKLAAQIRKAQNPEIRTMTSWLKSWGEPVSPDGMAGMGMDGIMSDEEMADLRAARGGHFDSMFARMMVAHHNGAIAMAHDEQRDGRSSKVRTLAATMIKAQAAEVNTLLKYSRD